MIGISYGDWAAQISARLGANVIRLTYKGKDVFRTYEEGEEQNAAYLIGAPLLLPANRTYKGKFTFEGKEYSLPINEPSNDCNLHGALLYQQFEVVRADESSVTLSFLDLEGACYPFPFGITVTYYIDGEGFHSVYEIENKGKGNMPLTFATHTTFIEPESFCVPIDMCQEKDAHHIPTGRYVELNEFQREFATGSESKGKFITGYFRACGNKARVGDYLYTVSENYDHFILYNGAGQRNLLCVEPQAGKVNGLNYPDGHTVLGKGEKVEFSTVISRI